MCNNSGIWEEPLARIDVIELSPVGEEDPLVWENNAATMTYARFNHNAVILPDRT